MSTALSTVFRLFSSRRAPLHDPDPADMGTCFGMEMTLQPPLEPTPAPKPAPAPGVRAAVAGGPGRPAAVVPQR